MNLPTVKIKNDRAPDGFAIINESDFDSKTMQLWSDKPVAKPEDAKPVVAAPKANVK